MPSSLTLGQFRALTGSLPDDIVLGIDVEDFSIFATGATYVASEKAVFFSNAGDDIVYEPSVIGPVTQIGEFFDPEMEAEEEPLGIGAATEDSCEETIKC